MRYGLIECGGIGLLCAAAAGKLPGRALEAVSDTNTAQATAVAKYFGGSAISDWHQLVQAADGVTVMVSTPPALHREK